ncbi:hypothetical protein NOF55_10425 [Rhizobiaceae bacterium BDR2-2]|uniref:Uncharacterized protein n=1 Tax=Ectorhizobium quercum TaxID=2965071 RepID=A0AAE3SW09_9HYPH|nr:hypothetical protein [Ectorhizobium quercum]MCX8997524.1 hypothetical protein [Ectorhizobium quercum]
MAPEWMKAMEAVRGPRGRAGLADPLEAAEWNGLQWIAGFLARLTRIHLTRSDAAQTAQTCLVDRRGLPI